MKYRIPILIFFIGNFSIKILIVPSTQYLQAKNKMINSKILGVKTFLKVVYHCKTKSMAKHSKIHYIFIYFRIFIVCIHSFSLAKGANNSEVE